MKYFLSIFSFLSIVYTSNADPVIIRGNAQDYAGQTLNLLSYSNQISNKEQRVASTTVQSNGDFEARLDIEKTQYVFCHSGIFFMYLFAEPGKEYVIKLPQRTEKKPIDKLNPFFEEIRVHLLVLSSKNLQNNEQADNQKELNFLIRTFDDYYEPFYTKYALNVYTKQAIKDLDTTLHKIEDLFGKHDHLYFKEYYMYRMGLLKFMSTRFKSRNISDNYFLNKPVLYNNPAYMELFNKTYDKYFVYFGRTKTGKVIYDDINQAKSLSRLKSTLGQDKILSNDTLKELVILKNIHDGCYEMEFARQSLLKILDSLISTSTIERHRGIGKEIRYKVTRLLPGYTPPPFKLLNQDSVLMSLDNFKGSFVYLVFGTTQNYACLKEFELLKKLQQKHPNLLKIVVVSVDEYLSDIKDYARKSKSKWTFLHYAGQADILKDYDIRTFPTCFLIDREGRLGLSPAPLPSENFETYLFNYLRANKVL